MRRVDADCNTTQEIVQGGTDPLRLDLSGLRYRLLDVVVQPISKERLARKDMFSPVKVFAQTNGEVTTEGAREILEYLRRLSGAADISVVLRNDPWFVEACEFPLLFLFDGVPAVIPSKADVLNAKQAYCGALKQWGVGCY